MRDSLLFISIASLLHLVTATENVTTYPILQPVSDEGWENSLNRRSTPADYLKLAESDHFVWSSALDSGDNIFVNMTMSTGEEELIISMERFASVLKNVNCSQDMMLAFKSNDSYSSAVASWDWVNFNENRTFIMIANYPGCGTAKSRQPWVVSNAAYDPANLVVHLNATEKTWKEVAHTYSLDFGRYGPPASTNSRRQFNGNKQVSIDLNHELPNSLSAGLGDSDKVNSVSLACNKCGTKGQLVLDGHIESAWFQVTVFTLTAQPVGVEADINLALTFTNDNPEFWWKPNPWTILSIPVGGFSIPELIEVGPMLNIGVGISLSAAKCSATISQSVKAVIPDSSIAQVSLAGNKGATFSGWAPQFEVGAPKVDFNVSATAEAYGQLALAVGITILGQGVDLSLSFKYPDFIVTAQPVFETTCGGKKVHAGVSLTTTVGAVLGLKAASHVDGVETDFVNKPLFSLGAKNNIPWASTCIPII